MISYPDMLDDWTWPPLFGGQLQDALPTEVSQQGEVQYGFKQSTGLVKTAMPFDISPNYETDLSWPLDDLDFLENTDSACVDTLLLLVEQNYSPLEIVPTLPSSPELAIIPEFDITSFNDVCESVIGFQNVEQFDMELKVPAQQSDFVDFDSHESLQDVESVLELLQVLGSNDTHFGQSRRIVSEPIPLPQMPPEVVESFLSISPASIESNYEDDALDFPPSAGSYEGGSAGSPGSASSCGSMRSDWSHASHIRVEPYPKEVKPERKVRKKEQNKTAALKYRQKKRDEQGSFMTECEQLQQKNVELKTRVDEITKEINYLKGLMAEMADYKSERGT